MPPSLLPAAADRTRTFESRKGDNTVAQPPLAPPGLICVLGPDPTGSRPWLSAYAPDGAYRAP